ncbi:major facilitator superfamily domain-containing protein [Roridomyces roridus]|uniref:Major facilitator superfamily domain-containing protein n=1 Tax=Roridomyces roridus TaxID=1738132 RepID=A0AAD7BF89_9AGAR|nr:major facilitator superfamily domain-containing protein [Roridomyces roridus]
MSEREDKTTDLTPTDLALDLEGRHSVAETIIGKEEDQKSPLPLTLAPDDPENPRNWTPRKKIMVTFVLCVSVLTLTYSSTAYVASLPALMNRYHISQEVAILGVTLTVLGFAAGPLLWAPASEIYGRRAVYVFTGIFYSIFSWGAAVSNNAASMLIFRFLIGFFGSSTINNVPASLGDYTTPAERGVYSICYALMAFGGPSIGPLISAFIQHDAGFRWNLRVMAIFSTVLSLAVAFVPETHGPTLLKKRVAKEGKAPSPLTLRMIANVFKTALARPIIYLFTEPVVMLVSIYLSVLYGILYGFFEAFTVVYLEIRGFSSTSYGLTYISLGLGFLFACVLLATIGQKLYLKSAEVDAQRGLPTQPEARLALAYYGAILSPISLFIFAWTAPFNHVHWIAPCIAEFLFATSMLLIFTGFVPYLIDCYLQTAASALAAGMASRAVFGGVFPLFSVQMYHKLSVQGASSLLAGIACTLAPIPFVFRAYGSRIRSRSIYAVTT